MFKELSHNLHMVSAAITAAVALACAAFAYGTNEQVNTYTGNPDPLRIFPKAQITGTFAPGSGTLAYNTPVAFNESLQKWVVWGYAPPNEVDTLTFTGTVSGGTFTLTINGQTTGTIAWNASNATVLAAILALDNIDASDIVITGGPIDATHPLILTWGGQYLNKQMTVTVTPASLTGGGTAVMTQTTPGAINNTWLVRGFTNDVLVLDGSNDTLCPINIAGEFHIDDIALPAGQTLANLKAHLAQYARDKNLIIRGIVSLR